jgi:hypothetical protein
MSLYKPLFQTYLIVVPALLAAGYSDIFSRIFTFRFSPRFFPDFCRFHIEIIFITYNGRNVYLYSLTQKTRESESVWRKCVGLTGLFPTCHGGQLTLKLWVTKQGFHPGVYYMNNMF